MSRLMNANSASRRRFLSKLGLGAGAALLTPIASSLFNRAMGQVPTTRRLVLLYSGNGMHRDWILTPSEHAVDKNWDPVLPGTTTYTWPAALKPLEPYRGQALLLDGLANQMPSSMHSCGYGALSCFTAYNGGLNEELGAPGNITIDQFIAREMDTAFRSVLVGVGPAKSLFASGPARPEAAITQPAQLHRALFGATASDANGVEEGNRLRQRLLFDVYREDLAKLKNGLAAEERIPYEHYLEAIETLDRQAMRLATIQCAPPQSPAASEVVEDRLEQLTSMATIALTCGMTNVVGISAGTGKSHNWFPKYTRALLDVGLDPNERDWTYGHAEEAVQKPGMVAVYNYLSRVMGSMIEVLKTIPEGDGTLFDNSVFVMSSCNAEAHHANHAGWPLVVVGGAGGALKADGRFVRYPQKGESGQNYRSLADFFCTVETAMGVP